MRPRPRPWAGDEGFTLPELIVTIAILGIAIVGLIGGLFGLVMARDTHRRVSRADGYLRTYAEAVKAAAYQDCTAPGAYDGISVTAADHALSVDSVECWNGDEPATFTGGGTFGAAENGAQRITLSVTGPMSRDESRRAHETLVILKRNPVPPA